MCTARAEEHRADQDAQIGRQYRGEMHHGAPHGTIQVMQLRNPPRMIDRQIYRMQPAKDDELRACSVPDAGQPHGEDDWQQHQGCEPAR